MHFCYLDETGCSGANLEDHQEPIFVLGGLAVKDKGWSRTTERFNTLLCDYFGVKSLPDGFELHSHHLLSPEGEGEFLGHERERRNRLAFDLLDLIADRQHQIHYIAVEKACIRDNATATTSPIFNARVPYLLGFNYLTTYLESFVRNHLGRTARGMVILDVKKQYQDDIERITHFRRFEVAATRRLKWLVEFTYPVDSARHPMIQLADLVIFCTRKFFEMDRGHRPEWSGGARTFYAQCFDRIYNRVWRKTFEEEQGSEGHGVNALLTHCFLRPRHQWRQHYGL